MESKIEKEKNLSKFKNKLNMSNIGIMLIILILGIFNLIIGANEKGLRIIPISILLFFIIFYLIVFKIRNKDKKIFFKNKIDIFVLAFMISTTFPLIFRTWASYSDTVEFILKYFFIYAVYILVRNSVKTKKQIEIIIVTTIIGSLFSIILNYSYTNGKNLKDFINWLDVTCLNDGSFSGTFDYPNAEAIYMAFCIFLAMHRFKVNKNKILKVVDAIYIFFSTYIIIVAAKSRAVFFLFGITLFILFIIKFRKQIIKHKIKILIGSFVFTTILIMFLNMALGVSKSRTNVDKNIKQYIRYNFKENEKYTLELELETIYTGSVEEFKDNSFIIKIYESGKYFIDRLLVEENFGEYNGIYKLEFTPTKDTDSIKVRILNKYKGIIKINRCYINGKEHIINYKYIPNDLAYIISGYTIKGKSLPQRLEMYKDCIKILKDSPIVGNGGDTWKNVSLAVEEYKVALKESHSYLFELLISYGISGTIAYYTFIIYFFIKMFKQCKKNEEKRKEKLLILLGLLIMIVHSLIDFDMSFMIIQLTIYVYIAILLYNEQENEIFKKLSYEKYNLIEYIIIIFLIFILSIYIRADISKYILKDNTSKHIVTPYNKKYYNEIIKEDIKNNKNYIEILNELKDYMEKELYYTQNENYERYFDLIYKNIDSLTKEELQKYLDFGITRVKEIREKSPMFFETVLERTKILTYTIKNFENYIYIKEAEENNKQKIEILKSSVKMIRKIIDTEYEKNINNLEEFDRNGYREEVKENYKKYYQEMIDSLK